jgi:purine catabolism regulator
MGANPAVVLESARRLGITVAEAMSLPSLARGRLVAGRGGADRRISSVNMMEVPDIGAYVRAGELLVTTAYPLRDDARAMNQLVQMLAGRDLAGLALKPGRYIDTLPAEMISAAERLSFPVIELPDDASFNDILADVLGSILNRHALELERSRAIHDRLTSVVLAGGSLAELLDALSFLVGHPAAAIDGHGEPLAAAGQQPPAGSQRTSRPIQAGKVRHGEVVVWAAEAELGADGVIALEHAATVAALQMAQARVLLSREQRHRALLLEELVSGQPLDRSEIAERAAAYGWNLSLPRSAIVIELRGGDQPLEEHLLGLVRSTLGRDAIAWGLRSGLAVLAASDGDAAGATASAERLAGAIRAETPLLHVAAGVGRRCDSVMDLHASYREAAQALSLGRDLKGGDFVLAYEELGIYRLLQALVTDSTLEAFCRDTLRPLLDYDAKHSGSLVRTLEVYLRHDRNMASAARELFVHYNTLRYRLDQISGLTGGMDRHATSRLALEVAVHGLKLLR